MAVYDLAKKANHKEVLQSIGDPEAKYIWNPPEDDNITDEEPTEATVQQQEQPRVNTDEFIQALDEPLMDEQALMVMDLFRSHACMMEWQGQVSILLGKLAILNSTVKPLHQVTLPDTLITKLPPPEKPKNITQTEALVQKSALRAWAEDSATLYLVATLHYLLKKMIVGSSNMKLTAQRSRNKLTGLCCCINGRRYVGGSKKAVQQ